MASKRRLSKAELEVKRGEMIRSVVLHTLALILIIGGASLFFLPLKIVDWKVIFTPIFLGVVVLIIANVGD